MTSRSPISATCTSTVKISSSICRRSPVQIVRLPAALVPIAWIVNRDPVAILRTA
ncbi:hypothetical protein V3M69_09455 [Trueperella pyogenes]|uniref:hypothetical protein n=1 Tax=Trueperella pyogenes TaxID=1661 RepID=UPI0014308AC1|nr:hypothetical protein [Trueperella pyogenes]